MQNDKEKLIVFDTTLRDGEQSAGASMSAESKVEIARQLERLGVDVIEAGFPASSPGDKEAVKRIAAAIEGSIVCGLARANDRDVDHALEAIAGAKRPRLHTFISTSPLHMKHKLGLAPKVVHERAIAAVKRARNGTDDVEFSPEDATRSDVDFLCRVLEDAIKAGATTLNIPDTVGYAMPHEYGGLIRNLRERIPNSDKAVFSTHCHNDLGVAVANTLAAIGEGARQVECTVNGIGERAGNAALEEIVMAIEVRGENFPVTTGINAAELVASSRMVEAAAAMPVQPNKAIVGLNAFAHESGIHQDGVLKNRETYEIMRPEDVGWSSNRLPLGKLSGRRAVSHRLAKLGKEPGPEELDAIFAAFKRLADAKRDISDEDLLECCAAAAEASAAAG